MAESAVLARAEAMKIASDQRENLDLTFNMSGNKKFLSDIKFTEDVADTSVAGGVHGATSAAKEVAGGTVRMSLLLLQLH
jgi:hypothetical protein